MKSFDYFRCTTNTPQTTPRLNIKTLRFILPDTEPHYSSGKVLS